MNGCILHFGMHKTGSSSIQEALYTDLRDPTFHYLGMAGPNQSADLVTLFAPNPLDHPIHRRIGTQAEELSERQERARANWVQHCLQAAGKIGILSGESMVTLPLEGLEALRNFIHEQTSSLRVVGYVRSPKAYIESAFQERLKDGRVDLDLEMFFPHYQHIFAKFIHCFGEENVEFWKFAPDTFPQGDVVLDFCARLGIDFAPQDALRINEGMSLSAVKLLYIYRHLGPAYGTGYAAIAQNQRLVAHISCIDGPRFRLHSSLVAPLLDRYREDIQWMEDRLHQSLGEDLSTHDEGAIATREDLFQLEPRETYWLAQQLGNRYVERWHERLAPQQVANWLHDWRIQL